MERCFVVSGWQAHDTIIIDAGTTQGTVNGGWSRLVNGQPYPAELVLKDTPFNRQQWKHYITTFHQGAFKPPHGLDQFER